MKKYMVFGHYGYYPSGGWGDFVDSFDTLEEVHTEGEKHENHDIIDSETFERVV